MSAHAREAFLAGVHVGVLSIARADGRGPWTVPIWYGYEPGGDVRVITGRDSPKTRLLRAAGRFSLCVQDEAPPYRYVTVEGPVVAIDGPVSEEERRSLARRYLGAEAGDAYVASTAGIGESEVLIALRPERWLSADFSG
jgi:PPOX class probable F420-dependent enzyme